MTDKRHLHRPQSIQAPTSLGVAIQLWTFTTGHHRWSATLQAPSAWGLEVHILRDGKLHMSRRFPKRAPAVAWAMEERTALLQAFSQA